jgi:ferredoxin
LTPYIDYGLCEACEACADVFPGLFEMRDGTAWVVHNGESAIEDPRAVENVCPFRAITVE